MSAAAKSTSAAKSSPRKSVSPDASPEDIIQFLIRNIKSINRTKTGPLVRNKTVTREDKSDINDILAGLEEAANVLLSKVQDLNATVTEDVSDVRAIVREELQKFGQDFAAAQPKSYAAAAASGPPAKSVKTPKSRPALVIAGSNPDVKSHDDVLGAWKKSVSFKDTDFAPARVQRVSNGKVRIEFEDVRQRDTALRKLESATDIKAEPAKRSRPLIIVKGISRDVQEPDVPSIIAQQNKSLQLTAESDIKLRFVRRNRKEDLFNAVLEVSPDVRLGLLRLERVNIDHQRVRVSDFSSFVQCFKCLQFGHTQAKCESDVRACSHCASSEHCYSDCPAKSDLTAVKCYNCNNQKSGRKSDSKHSATSSKLCPRIKSMVQRINERTDFGA